MAQNVLAFHSITGCDTTSFFYEISKKRVYKVYEQDANLLEGIGEAELTDEKIKAIARQLFSDKERKLGKLEGRGTLRFSITLLIGCTDFDLFFRVPDFIDCV
jgi:hypothetical protein